MNTNGNGTSTRISSRDRDAILKTLRNGLVPTRGLQHIQVGRHAEIKAIASDLDTLVAGGSAVRFIIGAYGSGKTFFLHVTRLMAIQKDIVVAYADLAPDRRLHASQGQARNLYRELMKNTCTRTSPLGGALQSILQKFVNTAMSDAAARDVPANHVIHERMRSLSELVGGYDFAQVVEAYWRGHEQSDEVLQDNALRWMRGEYEAKTDARKDLGVRTIVTDKNVYDMIKLQARFAQLAGYAGYLVNLDEMVNLYKLGSGVARRNNYEQILHMVNDSVQGTNAGLGFLFGGTPKFLTDTSKGLYSYEALRSRLAENRFSTEGLQDMSGPVIRLSQLTPEDLFILLSNLRRVHASGNEQALQLPDEALQHFMEHCFNKIGAAYFQTPRNVIKEFLDLLAILDQNPGARWEDLVAKTTLDPDQEPELPTIEDDEGGGLTSINI